MFRSKNKSINDLLKETKKIDDKDRIAKILFALEQEKIGLQMTGEPEAKLKVEKLIMVVALIKNFQEAEQKNKSSIKNQLSSIERNLKTLNQNYPHDPLVANVTSYVTENLNQYVKKKYPAKEFNVPAIKSNQVKMVKKLGSGGSGQVFLYQVTDSKLIKKLVELGFCEKPKKNGSVYIAIKVGQVSEDEIKCGEILWRQREDYLAASKTPLCNVSGGTTLDGERIILSRYESGGLFVDYLAKSNLNLKHDQETKGRQARILNQVILDSVTNMEFYHSAGILHLDTADRNLLITADGRTVRIDNGLSLEKGQNKFTINRRDEGPVRWLDYLIMGGRIFSEYSDLYALKVTILQFIIQTAGDTDPLAIFGGMSNDDIIKEQLQAGNAGVLKKLMGNLEAYLYANRNDPRCEEAAFILDCYRPFLSSNPSKEVLDSLLGSIRNENDKVKEKVINDFVSEQMRVAKEALVIGADKFENKFNAFKASKYHPLIKIPTSLSQESATTEKKSHNKIPVSSAVFQGNSGTLFSGKPGKIESSYGGMPNMPREETQNSENPRRGRKG